MTQKNNARPALILAAFGVSEPIAMTALLEVENAFQQAFPHCEASLSFTSTIIRGVWARRDEEFRESHPSLPQSVYAIKSPLTAVGLALEEGPRPVLVQSLFINNGEEYRDLNATISALAGVRYLNENRNPFRRLALSGSALGDGRPEELELAALALAPLFEEAQADGRTPVLMAHGSLKASNQVYADFEAVLRRIYSHSPVYIGLVEGEPGIDALMDRLDADGFRPGARLLLAPLMLTTGEHVRRDLAGHGGESWVGRLSARGFDAVAQVAGLGTRQEWLDLYLTRAGAALATLTPYRAPTGG